MFKYYLPIYYTLETRYKSKLHKLSFMIVTIFPSLLYTVCINGFGFKIILDFFVTFLAMHCIYECGYIYNDLITIQFESNPTNRIGSKSALLLRHLQGLITVRLIITSLIVIYDSKYYDKCESIIYLLIILMVDYTIHNFYRNIVNILTMCTMVYLKYFIPCFLFISPELYYEVSFFLIIGIVLLRTIEYASKDRFQLPFIKIKNFDSFRLKYYIIVFLMSLVIFVFKDILIINLFLIGTLTFFRTASFLLMKNNFIKKQINSNRMLNGNIKKIEHRKR